MTTALATLRSDVIGSTGDFQGAKAGAVSVWSLGWPPLVGAASGSRTSCRSSRTRSPWTSTADGSSYRQDRTSSPLASIETLQSRKLTPTASRERSRE
jgi:hypothetical protein